MAGRPRSPPLGLHRRDLDQDQHGAAARMGAEGRPAAGLRAARSLAHADLPRRPALRPAHRPLHLRRPDQRRVLPRLCRTAARPGPQARRHRHHGQSRQPQVGSASLHDQGAGARLWYLPPYSPDLNPIEQAFAKIKHWMRAAQKRTLEDTWRHIGSLIASINPDECANYFANAGYASAKP
jgi:DDE superfamily endonuclease